MNPLIRTSIAALAALLGACAYTGGGETGTGAAPTETTTTGVITGFGSIFVGGVEYFTEGAVIDRDGQTADETALAVGMVVTLRGTVNPDGTGQARQVAYRKNLKGPVQANTVPAGGDSGTLTVLGQTVAVDPYTVFDGDTATPTLDALAPGQMVEVSGFTTPNGIHATRVELKDPSDQTMEIKGRVSGLTATTFTLGGLTVNYADANPLPALRDGLAVEVKGSLQTDGTLIASEIDQEDELPGELRGQAGEEGELEGIVTAVGTDGTLTVNGQMLRVPAELAQQAQVGDRLEVEGRFDTDGVLQVSDWKRRPATGELARIQAPVEAVDYGNRTLTVLGATYRYTATTLVKDERDDDDRLLADRLLAAGDWVELRVHEESGLWQVDRLERKDPEDRREVKGTVTDIDGTSLIIAGLRLDLRSAPALPSPGQAIELSAASDLLWTWEADEPDGKPGQGTGGHENGARDGGAGQGGDGEGGGKGEGPEHANGGNPPGPPASNAGPDPGGSGDDHP